MTPQVCYDALMITLRLMVVISWCNRGLANSTVADSRWRLWLADSLIPYAAVSRRRPAQEFFLTCMRGDLSMIDLASTTDASAGDPSPGGGAAWSRWFESAPRCWAWI